MFSHQQFALRHFQKKKKQVILKISTSTPLATDFDIFSPISFPDPRSVPLD